MNAKTLFLSIFLLIVLTLGNSSYAQTILVKGLVRDTIKNVNAGNDRIMVILNDTLERGAAKLHAALNKRKPGKRTSAQNQEDSVNVSLWEELSKDKRFVVSPNQAGEFEILAQPTDSLIFTSHLFITQRHAVKDLIKQQNISINLEPLPCEPMVRCDDKNPTLYVFIAEKIGAKYAPPNYCPENGHSWISKDSRYQAKYKILENIYGDYSKDTITFMAFDHYGEPPFLNYKYVMLFVSEHCGQLIHEKYQYFDIYPTADGRWARPGDPYRFDTNQPKLFKAQKLKFKENLSFDIGNEYKSVIAEKYPKPYFKITRDKAYPLTGVYSEDLFSIKKDGVLKARGYVFGAKGSDKM
ncbi:hypothetical protein [Pedobacter ginsengisoli]|uniref:hypothetical protein n=1 Tax=Pedobacter ginsengisoli TaxID=363852 RepID=UPI00254C5465|nr:hypothetical protein [Pedobacter ginsengisoli]